MITGNARPPGDASAALQSAIVAASKITICPDCHRPANAGLCRLETCRRAVLPQMKESSLRRDAHSGMYHEAHVAERDESLAAKRAKRRNERKEQKALERKDAKARGRRAELVHAGGFDRYPLPIAA
jgi:hypothetical protein